MRKANIFVLGCFAGILQEFGKHKYHFEYDPAYSGPPVSLTMPITQPIHEYNDFPPFFDGLLPEGEQLEALLCHTKIDRSDNFSQLIQVGADVVGGITITERAEHE